MTAATPLLEVRDLTAVYRRHRTKTTALHDVNFDIRPGESVGLVGESGSGKSTLGNAILGVVPAQAGTITFDGKDVTRADRAARRKLYEQIQMVFQDPYSSLNPDLTIGATLAEPLRANRKLSRSQIQDRVCDMLEAVHLSRDAARRYPDQFSGGQRQRIAIARALMLSPRLVICDEPVSALDLSVQAQILNLLRELQQKNGLTYLFISHDLDVINYMCDRVVVLYQGRVMESGDVSRVATSPSHPYTYALQEASPVPAPKAQRARRIARSMPAASPAAERLDTQSGCVFARRCQFVEDRCWQLPPPRREIAGEGFVFCHRYPEWRSEAGRKGDTPADRSDQAHPNGRADSVREIGTDIRNSRSPSTNSGNCSL